MDHADQKSAAIQEYLQSHQPAGDSPPAVELIAASCDLLPGEDFSLLHYITLSVGNDEEITAASIKSYNVLRLQPLDFLFSLSKISLSLIATSPEKIQAIGLNTIAGWLLVLFEFSPLFKHQFSPQTSKVLYAIALLRQGEFSAREVKKKYEAEFGEPLGKGVLKGQLKTLSLWKCILPAGREETYQLNESIQISRKLS